MGPDSIKIGRCACSRLSAIRPVLGEPWGAAGVTVPQRADVRSRAQLGHGLIADLLRRQCGHRNDDGWRERRSDRHPGPPCVGDSPARHETDDQSQAIPAAKQNLPGAFPWGRRSGPSRSIRIGFIRQPTTVGIYSDCATPAGCNAGGAAHRDANGDDAQLLRRRGLR